MEVCAHRHLPGNIKQRFMVFLVYADACLFHQDTLSKVRGGGGTPEIHQPL